MFAYPTKNIEVFDTVYSLKNNEINGIDGVSAEFSKFSLSVNFSVLTEYMVLFLSRG